VRVIGDLGADDELIGDLSGEVDRAVARGDRGAASAALADLLAAVRTHTRVEEASLFAALRAEGEMVDHVDALASDHVRLVGGGGRLR
jgi:hypothetical protein